MNNEKDGFGGKQDQFGQGQDFGEKGQQDFGEKGQQQQQYGEKGEQELGSDKGGFAEKGPDKDSPFFGKGEGKEGQQDNASGKGQWDEKGAASQGLEKEQGGSSPDKGGGRY